MADFFTGNRDSIPPWWAPRNIGGERCRKIAKMCRKMSDIDENMSDFVGKMSNFVGNYRKKLTKVKMFLHRA